ncbi:MAG: matrixin family metalloprotease [Deltaproteobacteria bacterium]|nr:matrixin family metalloprotease [Deltaproteobacteria bacterium]
MIKKTLIQLLFFLLPAFSFAFLQESYWANNNRAMLSWGGGSQQITLALNIAGNPQTVDSREFSAFIQAMNAWNTHFGTFTNFAFKAVTTSQKTLDGLDGVNNVFFENMGAVSTVAETRSTFFVSNGRVIDTDIRFNTFYIYVYGDAATGFSQINLADVATHEFGHAAGLGHSSFKNATMYFMAQDKQRFPTHDDLAGIHTIYPVGNTTTLSGKIQKGSENIHGAEIIAIRTDEGPWQGKPWVNDLSDRSGNFSIRGLDVQGQYMLLAVPLHNHSPHGNYFSGSHNESDFVENILGTTVQGHLIPTLFSSSQSGLNIQVSQTVFQDDYENNDTVNTAFDLSTLSSNALIATADKVSDAQDFYKISLNQGDRIDVSTTAFQIRSGLDLEIEVGKKVGSTFSKIESNDDHPYDTRDNKDPFIFQFEAAQTQDYYIRVKAKNNLVASDFPGSSSDGKLASRMYVFIWNQRQAQNASAVEAPLGLTLDEFDENTGATTISVGSSGFSVLEATLNKLLIESVSLSGSNMLIQLQPGMNGKTNFFIKNGTLNNTTYRQVKLTINPVNYTPFIFTSQSQTSFDVTSGGKLNLSLAGIVGGDDIDNLGVNINGVIIGRVAGVLPSHTLTATASNANVNVNLSIDDGSYMLQVSGPVGESATIDFEIKDSQGNTIVTSNANSSAASSPGVTVSSPSQGSGIIVNIVDAARSVAGATGGGCGTVFNEPYQGNFNQYFNLFILLLPLLFLSILRKLKLKPIRTKK